MEYLNRLLSTHKKKEKKGTVFGTFLLCFESNEICGLILLLTIIGI